MEAVLLGIKKLDFSDGKEQVKRTMYYVCFPAHGIEGNETGKLSWDEIKNGPPPNIHIGEVIEIERGNGRDKLQFPPPKLTDAFRITIDKTPPAANAKVG